MAKAPISLHVTMARDQRMPCRDFFVHKRLLGRIGRATVLWVARNDLEARLTRGELRTIPKVKTGLAHEVCEFRKFSGEEFQAIMGKVYMNHPPGTDGDRPKIVRGGQDGMLVHSHSPCVPS